MGADRPSADLRVSPPYRILVRSAIARRMFDAVEVLLPARRLPGLEGISVDAARDGVTHLHLLFDQHEVAYANGAAGTQSSQYDRGGGAWQASRDLSRPVRDRSRGARRPALFRRSPGAPPGRPTRQERQAALLRAAPADDRTQPLGGVSYPLA
ncbi:Hint domain-containing protein [Ponticoccus sp. SC2-23]|nr:Hint domain-containing protein [Ponticoccus sp. SC6-9]MBM1225784.1 Hint domain-containing protein [Ponticoccus sp. SC6-15]MBM1227936.1 Hint domain-containing protein [Ponticoccus sp. SC6-38]MBM1234426.1 Hint domain-containing protein [Ponticoccus sp. SC6-45]MBM1238438.1 Hint domain-containing protein [Ponticoccus sp. SC6-49]MBM1243707.1 Hint domain-containing protein [Ponticoccus sp. SC2-64]MBM1247950.1 Hint domain-containing protein [Ponticoccus sp. SC6-42]MBM1252838.1 Hint domain-contai